MCHKDHAFGRYEMDINVNVSVERSFTLMIAAKMGYLVFSLGSFRCQHNHPAPWTDGKPIYAMQIITWS